MPLSFDPLKDSKYALVRLLIDDFMDGCDYMFKFVFRNYVRNERCVAGKCIKLTVCACVCRELTMFCCLKFICKNVVLYMYEYVKSVISYKCNFSE